jgi:hypothetical protein
MGCVVSVTPQPRFTPGKRLPLHFVQEVGWASVLVWTQRLEKNSFASAGDRTPVVQSVVRHYNDWATTKHRRVTYQNEAKVQAYYDKQSQINSVEDCTWNNVDSSSDIAMNSVAIEYILTWEELLWYPRVKRTVKLDASVMFVYHSLSAPTTLGTHPGIAVD